MFVTFQDRAAQTISSHWQSLPERYRTPLLLTTTTALLLTPLIYKTLTYTPTLLPPPSPPSPNPIHLTALNPSASSTFTLPDGRILSYATYGSPTGKPIFSLHGLLGSRLESALFDADARALGIRIIAPERPGIGRSSPDATRPPPHAQRARRMVVVDHAADIAALADHLQLDAYAVLGTSGGGPYALACAAAASTTTTMRRRRLRVVSVVTGLGLPDMPQAWPRCVVWLNSRLPLRWLHRRLFLAGPVWRMALSDEARLEAYWRGFDAARAHPADVATATRRARDYWDWVRLFLASAREAVAQGPDGFLDDAAVLSSRDPGFRVEDIRADLPVQLWCGTEDTNVSPLAGDETARRLRKAGNRRVELHMLVGETHGSVQVKCRRRVLEDILRAWDS